MWKEISVWTFLTVIVINNVCESSPASTHMHSGREREEDGGFSPRDHNHLVNGEHHSEFDHEAILGSVKEAEEFDQLPPEEAKKRLAVLLKKMDLDGDENISRKELKAWILRSFSWENLRQSLTRKQHSQATIIRRKLKQFYCEKLNGGVGVLAVEGDKRAFILLPLSYQNYLYFLREIHSTLVTSIPSLK